MISTPVVLLINLVAFWLRHALFAGIASVACRAGRGIGVLRRIQATPATREQKRREIASSAMSGVVFVGVMGALMLLSEHGYTRIYHDVDTYGTGWFVGSIGCMVLIHDAYFYWTHRLRHEVELFWRAHGLHHTFTNPTSWAAFASTPAEALIEAGVLPLIVWMIPVHPAAIFCFTSLMTAQSVALHCGFELRPRSWRGAWMGPRAHNDHHRGVRGNYGLYTTLWDLAMGTYVGAERAIAEPAARTGTDRRSAAA